MTGRERAREVVLQKINTKDAYFIKGEELADAVSDVWEELFMQAVSYGRKGMYHSLKQFAQEVVGKEMVVKP